MRATYSLIHRLHNLLRCGVFAGVIAIGMMPRIAEASRFFFFDPGHGGNENGTDIGVAIPEKTLNLLVALDIVNQWSTYASPGDHIDLTRWSDETVSLQARVDAASRGTMLVSVHHNAYSHFNEGYVMVQTQQQITLPPLPYLNESLLLGDALTKSLRSRFHARLGIYTRPMCWIPNFECSPDTFIYVLTHSTVPAALVEAAAAGRPELQLCALIGDPPDGLLASEATSIILGVLRTEARNTSATFARVFATADSAFAMTSSESGSKDIVLLKWPSEDPLSDPDTLIRVSAHGEGASAVYRVPVDVQNCALQWMERDSLGLCTWSDKFMPGQASGEDLAILASAPALYEPLSLAERIDDPPPPGGDPCAGIPSALAADFVIYCADTTLGGPVFRQVSQDIDPRLSARLIRGANSAAAFRDSLRMVLCANATANGAALGSRPSPWPTNPGPEVYLAGSMQTFLAPTLIDGSAALYNCGTDLCLSDVALYDISGPMGVPDGIPDGPFSRVTCATAQHAERASLYAHEYNATISVDPNLGFMVGRGTDPLPIESEVVSRMQSIGLRYLGEVVEPFNTIGMGLGWPAFLALARQGLAEIFACGGFSSAQKVPGDFLTCDAAAVNRRQRALFWGPGCEIAAVYKPDSYFTPACGMPMPLLNNYLFGPGQTTTFAAAVGSIGSGFDKAHLEVGRVMMEERAKAATLGGSVARVVYNTIRRIAAEEPEYLSHALGIGILGSYVDLDWRNRYFCQYAELFRSRSISTVGGSISCYNSAIINRRILACPGGDATGWEMTVTVNHPGGTTLDLLNSMRLQVVADRTSPSITMWDERGAAVQSLAPVRVDLPSQSASFELYRMSGCGGLTLDLTIAGRTQGRVFEHQVSSVDYEPSALGLVDMDDIDDYWSGACLGGICSSSIMTEHRAHMIPRRLLFPRGGETFLWGDVVPVVWEPLGGNDPAVRVTLWQPASINSTNMGVFPAGTGQTSWSISWGTPEGLYYVDCEYGSLNSGFPSLFVPTGNVSGVFSIRAPVGGDPGGGCPEVAVMSAGHWQRENTILGQSPVEGLSFDACHLRFVDPRDTLIRLRIFENADATTNIKSLRLIRLVHEADEVLYASGDSALVGRRVSPLSVIDSDGNDVTANFSLGGHGLQLEPGRPIVAHWAGGQNSVVATTEGDYEVHGDGGDSEIIDDGGGKGGSGLRSATTYAVAEPGGEATGLIVSVPDSAGSWHEVSHLYPRLDPSGWALALGAPDSVRISSLDRRWVRFVGRLHPSDALPVAEKLENVRVVHNRDGDLSGARDSLGNVSATVAPGDTIYLEYRSGAPVSNKVQEFVLLSAGAYSRTLPAGSQPDSMGRPPRFAVSSVGPNPTRRSTTFSYEVPVDALIEIKVFDLQGRVVRQIGPSLVAPGRYSAQWDGRYNGGEIAPPGVYLYRFSAGGFAARGRVVLLP